MASMARKIPQAELEELRVALTSERDNLEEELAGHGRILNDMGDWQGAAIGFEGDEADPNDAADQIEELVTNVPLVAELEEKHTAIVEALEKMDDGTYGLCEECGDPIPLERLKVAPSARTCVEHTPE